MPIGHSWELEAGQRFNMLTVVSKVPSEGRHNMWECVCDCGNHTVVRASVLVKGHTKSCGCYRARRRTGNTLLRDRIIDALDGGDLNLREIYDTIGIADKEERVRARAALGRLLRKQVVSKVGMTPTIPSVGIYHLREPKSRVIVDEDL